MLYRLATFLFLANVLFSNPNAHCSGEISSPALALEELIKGNIRHDDNIHSNPNRNQERRMVISEKQTPFAIIVGCSDSRVTPEIIFDQGLGDLFVIRVAGNVVGPIELSSIEYGAEVLNAPLIMVLGHENCGAIKAVLAHQTQDIEPIAMKVEEAIKKYTQEKNITVEEAVKANIKGVVNQLKSNHVLNKLIEAKKLEIVGGYYELNSGIVRGDWNETKPNKPLEK